MLNISKKMKKKNNLPPLVVSYIALNFHATFCLRLQSKGFHLQRKDLSSDCLRQTVYRHAYALLFLLVGHTEQENRKVSGCG